MFGISEAGHFKCRVLIDTDEYYALCMHDRLSPESDVFRVTWPVWVFENKW